MKTTFSEQEMVVKFCETLEKEGKTFAVEVPFFSRSIDLVFTDSDGNYSAIEFKLKNWRQAISQAKCYMLGAEFAFICIPKNTYNERVEREILNSNCGLIIFDEEKEKFEIIKKPRPKERKGRFLMEKGFVYAQNNKNYEHLLTLA
jgi:hypothetical protein